MQLTNRTIDITSMLEMALAIIVVALPGLKPLVRSRTDRQGGIVTDVEQPSNEKGELSPVEKQHTENVQYIVKDEQ